MDRLKLDMDESCLHEQWKSGLFFMKEILKVPKTLLNEFGRRRDK